MKESSAPAIPVAAPSPSAHADSPAAVEEATLQVIPGGDPGLVLLVDDDFDVRMAVQDILEGEGYRIIAAANGKDALAILAQGARPSLLLLDLMMPVMNGWALFEALADSDIPIVIFSAFENSAQTFSRAAGILSKPVNHAALFEVVKRYCGTPPPRRVTSEGFEVL